MKLLIDEQPLQLLPSLVNLVGMNGAVFLQQLHFRSLISRNVAEGHVWIYKTYSDWTEEFTFWSSNTIRRIINDLEDKGYVISTNKHNKLKIDKTKWYRIDYTKLSSDTFGSQQAECPEPSHASVVHEQVDCPELPHASVDSGQDDVSVLGEPLLKELKETKKNKDIVEMPLDVAQFVIDYLNNKTGKQFKAQSAATKKFINGRVNEGYTQEDFLKVIDHKVAQWINNPEFQAYLRPSTLFNATNFENYLNEQLTSRPARRIPVSTVLDFSQGEDDSFEPSYRL